jgi:hypothetical protein
MPFRGRFSPGNSCSFLVEGFRMGARCRLTAPSPEAGGATESLSHVPVRWPSRVVPRT